jgi:AraC family ethanolamine operon transcriptional activator
LLPGERWRVVRRAEAFIEAHPGAALRIDELCNAACTSLSTLERVFREVFGITPRRYLTLRRLAAVRRELMNGDPARSITEVATQWGFFHLSRFAQEYGQLYNERPSQTRARR